MKKGTSEEPEVLASRSDLEKDTFINAKIRSRFFRQRG